MNPPPPPSPLRPHLKRPSSMMMRPSRSTSRLSMISKPDASISGSRTPDDDERTAVKVAIRVRPPLHPSDPGYDLIPQRFRGSTSEVTSPTNISIQSPQGKKLFVFDQVFDQDAEQGRVWDYISDSVESFVQGYNVTVLAYGQSGAGKSYTMGTSGAEEQDDPKLRGIIPRAAAALFSKLSGGPPTGIRSPSTYSGLPTMQSMPKLGQEKTWQLKATYVEIYNEQLRDLLVDENIPHHERPQVSIREDTKGRILLTGLNQVDINSVEDLLQALDFGSSIRQTDATAVNAKSSRSHAVFSLNLIQRNSPSGTSGTTTPLDKRRSVPVTPLSLFDSVTMDSKLHFVDLAGSERLKNTGAQGERAREGISINAGLASLGKVISQLSSRNQSAHVSYRDSKLTRLLQDSLGGIAVTYMIACINPAEFHLSETLNTVTYAQRARAIQSKPELQQSLSDADKNALIERLKAEITSLREIVARESPTKTNFATRSDAKANELQDQLTSMQENYNALSQRHEMMISELGLSTEDLNRTGTGHVFTDDAVARLQRSSSLSQAVENVVLEYEKTIQSLESSLSNTRSTLSTTETELNERESRIAYLEAAAAQSQKKVIKLMDREANTEQYLQELEGQLEGVASTEESTATLISGLRKELTRAKDNQSTTEDYIVALEERLAEAERDQEMMKRDLDRLEQLVDRQRSIGSVERQTPTNDVSIKQSIERPSAAIHVNGFSGSTMANYDHHAQSPPSPLGIHIDDNHGGMSFGDDRSPVSPLDDDMDAALDRAEATLRSSQRNGSDHDQGAQSSFMADKVETLTQELFDLRGEHESTLGDFHELRQKYAIALQTLAKVQDSQDKIHDDQAGPSTPPLRSDSFLGQALPGTTPQQTTPQHTRGESLYSLRSASEYSSQPDYDMDDQTVTPPAVSPGSVSTPIAKNSDSFAINSQADLQELEASNVALMEAHREATVEIEQLKAELHKTKSSQQSSPMSSPIKSPLVRRKPSQDLMLTMGATDRANRAFASLRNIALDNLESNTDVRQNFEIQLNTIMTELHLRTERAQEVESEMLTLRKQLEEKMTIINGLTRERSTLKSSPTLDFSAVSHMRDQLIENEHRIRHLQETHASEQQLLQSDIRDLNAQLETHLADKRSQINDDQVKTLQAEISAWEVKHNNSVESIKVTEAKLLATISDLEASLKTTTDSVNLERSKAEENLARHGEVVAQLQQQIELHHTAMQEHETKLQSLKDSHGERIEQLKRAEGDALAREAELAENHSKAVHDLNSEIEKHQSTTTGLFAGLASILGRSTDSDTYQNHIRELVVSKQELEARDVHSASARKELEDELDSVQARNNDLQGQIDELKTLHDEALQKLDQLSAKEEKSSRLVAELEDQLNSNYDANEAQTKRLSQMQSFTQLKLQDVLKSKAEHEKEIEVHRSRASYLEAQLNELRRRSSNSFLRESGVFSRERDSLSPEAAAIALARSASPDSNSTLRRLTPPMNTTALPSPPPVIPLPPLPGSPPPVLSALPNGDWFQPPHSHTAMSSSPDPALVKQLDESEARIRTVEKHLYAEKQLTATLEEALVDLETAQNKARQELDGWKRRAKELEEGLIELQKERSSSRASMQQYEEERELRMRAEAARRGLEERMRGLEIERKKKKKGGLNCF